MFILECDSAERRLEKSYGGYFLAQLEGELVKWDRWGSIFLSLCICLEHLETQAHETNKVSGQRVETRQRNEQTKKGVWGSVCQPAAQRWV